MVVEQLLRPIIPESMNGLLEVAVLRATLEDLAWLPASSRLWWTKNPYILVKLAIVRRLGTFQQVEAHRPRRETRLSR